MRSSTSLRDAINKLALTHHALAAEAQHNNPETLKDKLAELAEVGNKSRQVLLIAADKLTSKEQDRDHATR